MTWPWKRKSKHDEMMGMFNVLIESQNKTNLAVMNAVSEMAQAGAKQAEVLNQYLKLFQSPTDPVRWEADPQEENLVELRKAGFPEGGSEAEQAEWVLQHLETM